MIVVKIGGSLYDHPGLGPALRTYLDSLESTVLLVPGGGTVTDAVREWDAIHHLGEEAAHWLALQSLTLTAHFLRHLTLGCTSHLTVLDAFAFAVEDDSRRGALPHSWAVTSDSIAARAAVIHQAERLILLKSVDVPHGVSWAEAAERGWVDHHFPGVIAGAMFPIEVVNFRHRLDELSDCPFSRPGL